MKIKIALVAGLLLIISNVYLFVKVSAIEAKLDTLTNLTTTN